MPLAEDDLKRGMWIAVVGKKTEPPIHPWTGQPMQDEYRGTPYEVLAVNLPFVAVTDGHRRFTIDVRVWTLTRVSRQYREALEGVEVSPESPPRRHRRRRKQKPDPSLCPRCGDRIVQRLSKTDRAWHYYCRNCGLDGGPVLC